MSVFPPLSLARALSFLSPFHPLALFLPLGLSHEMQAQREAEKAERESQAQTINMDAQLMLAKEVSSGASSILAAAKGAGSAGIASMVAGLRDEESSDSSDSDED